MVFLWWWSGWPLQWPGWGFAICSIDGAGVSSTSTLVLRPKSMRLPLPTLTSLLSRVCDVTILVACLPLGWKVALLTRKLRLHQPTVASNFAKVRAGSVYWPGEVRHPRHMNLLCFYRVLCTARCSFGVIVSWIGSQPSGCRVNSAPCRANSFPTLPFWHCSSKW